MYRFCELVLRFGFECQIKAWVWVDHLVFSLYKGLVESWVRIQTLAASRRVDDGYDLRSLHLCLKIPKQVVVYPWRRNWTSKCFIFRSTNRWCHSKIASGIGPCPLWTQVRPPVAITSRDRCYDFLNIFAKNFNKKMAFLTQNKANFWKNWSQHWHLRKTPFISPKIGKNRRKLWS
jgi:hypothetical protein